MDTQPYDGDSHTAVAMPGSPIEFARRSWCCFLVVAGLRLRSSMPCVVLGIDVISGMYIAHDDTRRLLFWPLPRNFHRVWDWLWDCILTVVCQPINLPKPPSLLHLFVYPLGTSPCFITLGTLVLCRIFIVLHNGRTSFPSEISIRRRS